jgi:hypothetical protein
MAMRATAGRVTKMSPAPLLYGRELRLPAQLVDPRTSSSIVYDGHVGDIPNHYREYAEKLNTHISASPGTLPWKLLIQLKWTPCATPFGARILTSS